MHRVMVIGSAGYGAGRGSSQPTVTSRPPALSRSRTVFYTHRSGCLT